MRDISINQITEKEKIDFLENLLLSYKLDKNINDITPLIIQNIIKSVRDNETIIKLFLSQDELEMVSLLKSQIYESFSNCSDYSRGLSALNGFYYQDLLKKWTNTPPPSEYERHEIICMILEVLTNTGSIIWPGEGTDTLEKIITSQIKEHKNLKDQILLIYSKCEQNNGSITLEQIKNIVDRVDR